MQNTVQPIPAGHTCTHAQHGWPDRDQQSLSTEIKVRYNIWKNKSFQTKEGIESKYQTYDQIACQFDYVTTVAINDIREGGENRVHLYLGRKKQKKQSNRKT